MPRRRVHPSCWLALLLAGCLSEAGPQNGAAGAGARSGPGAGSDSDDACGGLVHDQRMRLLTSLAAPAPGQAVTDPAFGTTIRRITAVSPAEGENAIIKPVYGTVQAWNADESRLVLWHRGRGHELYDGRTYRFLKPLSLVS